MFTKISNKPHIGRNRTSLPANLSELTFKIRYISHPTQLSSSGIEEKYLNKSKLGAFPNKHSHTNDTITNFSDGVFRLEKANCSNN